MTPPAPPDSAPGRIPAYAGDAALARLLAAAGAPVAAPDAVRAIVEGVLAAPPAPAAPAEPVVPVQPEPAPLPPIEAPPPPPAAPAPPVAAPPPVVAAPVVDIDSLINGFGREVTRVFAENKVYPRVAMMRNMTGKIMIKLDFANGALVGIALISSSGHKVLDDGALADARRMKFPAPTGSLAQQTFSLVIPVDYIIP